MNIKITCNFFKEVVVCEISVTVYLLFQIILFYMLIAVAVASPITQVSPLLDAIGYGEKQKVTNSEYIKIIAALLSCNDISDLFTAQPEERLAFEWCSR